MGQEKDGSFEKDNEHDVGGKLKYPAPRDSV